MIVWPETLKDMRASRLALVKIGNEFREHRKIESVGYPERLLVLQPVTADGAGGNENRSARIDLKKQIGSGERKPQQSGRFDHRKCSSGATVDGSTMPLCAQIRSTPDTRPA
ncbi:MAG: hypothetical protein ABSD74_10080 [Rhizomicrobium sp.]|jgi:hypothetical protein